MKALVLENISDMQIKDLPEPTVSGDEVKIKVKYSGICGTDKHLYLGLPGSADAEMPVVLGHENSGEVVAVGPDVVDIKVGDRVAIDPNIYCGYCKYCRQGRPQLCEHLSAVGVTRNGGLEEYTTAPQLVVYRLPDSVSYLSGAMVEPISCVMHGIKRLNLEPAQKALVIGDGFIAQLFTQILAASGLSQIDVSGHSDHKRELLGRCGATHFYNNATEEVPTGYDVVIECVGLPATQTAAVEQAGKGGQVLMFGVANPTDTFALNSYEVFQKELDIKGSFINPYVFEDSIALLASGKVNVEMLISDEITLDQVADDLAGKFDHPINKAVVNIEKSL